MMIKPADATPVEFHEYRRHEGDHRRPLDVLESFDPTLAMRATNLCGQKVLGWP